MTDLNNMKISVEALENIIGGKASASLSPCLFGIHKKPEWDIKDVFYYDGHEYWYSECARCGKDV